MKVGSLCRRSEGRQKPVVSASWPPSRQALLGSLATTRQHPNTGSPQTRKDNLERDYRGPAQKQPAAAGEPIAHKPKPLQMVAYHSGQQGAQPDHTALECQDLQPWEATIDPGSP